MLQCWWMNHHICIGMQSTVNCLQLQVFGAWRTSFYIKDNSISCIILMFWLRGKLWFMWKPQIIIVFCLHEDELMNFDYSRWVHTCIFCFLLMKLKWSMFQSFSQTMVGLRAYCIFWALNNCFNFIKCLYSVDFIRQQYIMLDCTCDH